MIAEPTSSGREDWLTNLIAGRESADVIVHWTHDTSVAESVSRP